MEKKSCERLCTLCALKSLVTTSSSSDSCFASLAVCANLSPVVEKSLRVGLYTASSSAIRVSGRAKCSKPCQISRRDRFTCAVEPSLPPVSRRPWCVIRGPGRKLSKRVPWFSLIEACAVSTSLTRCRTSIKPYSKLWSSRASRCAKPASTPRFPRARPSSPRRIPCKGITIAGKP